MTQARRQAYGRLVSWIMDQLHLSMLDLTGGVASTNLRVNPRNTKRAAKKVDLYILGEKSLLLELDRSKFVRIGSWGLC